MNNYVYKYKKRIPFNLFFIVLLITFLFGGVLQFFNILSNTQCTILITSLCAVLFFSSNNKNVIYKPYIYLFLLIIISALYNSSSLLLTILYIVLFCFTPFFIYFLVWNNYKRYSFLDYKKILLFIGIIQMPIILLQHYFYPVIQNLSAKKIAEVDVGSGSFFLSNDHALCFYILCLIVFLLFDKQKEAVKRRPFLLVWFSVTILIAQSNVSIILLVAIWLLFVFIKNWKKSIIYLAIISIALGLLISFFPVIKESIYASFIRADQDFISKDYSDLNLDTNAKRSDIVAFYYDEKLKIIGEGPYDYFDIRDGGFKHFSNYSQYIWFYNDIGIIGLLLIPFLFYKVLKTTRYLFKYKYIILGMILVYSFFTNTLSDLAFIFTFSLFVLTPNTQNNSSGIKKANLL